MAIQHHSVFLFKILNFYQQRVICVNKIQDGGLQLGRLNLDFSLALTLSYRFVFSMK